MAEIFFVDRADAGERLGRRLLAEGLGRATLVGILRGGLVVAHHAGSITGARVQAVAASKLRAPGQPELAIGAITAAGPIYLDEIALERLGVEPEYLAREVADRRRQAAANQLRFGPVDPLPMADVGVVVDDGLATGATAIAAGRLLRSLGAGRLVVAVPVAPPATLQKLLESEFDAAVCLHSPDRFWAVGQFFARFEEVDQAQLGKLARAAGLDWHPTGDDSDPGP